MANEKNLIPFQKGKSGNPKGRPPKIFSDMAKRFKAEGFESVNQSRIAEAYEMLLALPESKLKEIMLDKDQPVIFKMLIKNMTSARGFAVIESMLDRAIGKPTQQIKSTIEATPDTILGFNVIINKKEE